LPLSDTATLYVLGDWIEDFSYLEVSAHETRLLDFRPQ